MERKRFPGEQKKRHSYIVASHTHTQKHCYYYYQYEVVLGIITEGRRVRRKRSRQPGRSSSPDPRTGERACRLGYRPNAQTRTEIGARPLLTSPPRTDRRRHHHHQHTLYLCCHRHAHNIQKNANMPSASSVVAYWRLICSNSAVQRADHHPVVDGGAPGPDGRLRPVGDLGFPAEPPPDVRLGRGSCAKHANTQRVRLSSAQA